jgi:diphosphomevalonate decarboxylase
MKNIPVASIEDLNSTTKGSVGWKSPSNLAIVKYWGKYGTQFPRNASLSLTLSNAVTRTRIDYEYKEKSGISLEFKFEGQPKPNFESRVRKFLNSIIEYFPFLNHLHLKIASKNSFPHSSGIASSASSMSALALCLCEMEIQLSQNKIDQETIRRKASFIARLGSGSACRSVYPEAAIWGDHPEIEGASREYAIPYGEMINDAFKEFHDDILIVSGKEKSVSSTAGHALMEDNIYSDARYRQAQLRMKDLVSVMASGDVDAFGKIAEDEALTLHALMMCSNPSYMLMEPGSISIINKVKAFRSETRLPVYFSLDAGPNIHLLYPHEIYQDIDTFVEDELKQYCVNATVLKDKVGKGPEKL